MRKLSCVIGDVVLLVVGVAAVVLILAAASLTTGCAPLAASDTGSNPVDRAVHCECGPVQNCNTGTPDETN